MNKEDKAESSRLQDRTSKFDGEDMYAEQEEDYVVCNMNIEGMSGYRSEDSLSGSTQGREILSKRETRQFMLTATLTGLLVAAVFSTVLILLTLFCTQIWFK